MFKENLDIIKEKISLEALKIIPFDGLNGKTLEIATQKAGYDKHLSTIFFAGGINELLELYSSRIDQQMLDEIKKLPLLEMKVRERIIEAVKIRLKLYSKNKLAIAKIIAHFALPFNAPQGLKQLWHTVDLIWYEAGLDKSTDFNYYTKRTLLASVYSSTLMYWLSDDSEGSQDTVDFLERKIEQIIKLGKFLNPKR
jgi:ubiquinone biosynthesis protein COQ9